MLVIDVAINTVSGEHYFVLSFLLGSVIPAKPRNVSRLFRALIEDPRPFKRLCQASEYVNMFLILLVNSCMFKLQV